MELDRLPLALCPVRECGKVEPGEPLVGQCLEADPEQALALDAERQQVELLEAAERRVARQLPVELHPPGALGQPGDRRLDGGR
jgi:hypothetical protein